MKHKILKINIFTSLILSAFFVCSNFAESRASCAQIHHPESAYHKKDEGLGVTYKKITKIYHKHNDHGTASDFQVHWNSWVCILFRWWIWWWILVAERTQRWLKESDLRCWIAEIYISSYKVLGLCHYELFERGSFICRDIERIQEIWSKPIYYRLFLGL